MTNFAPTTSGTETSVPVAGLPFAIPPGSDPNTVAAMQSMWVAMAALQQAQALSPLQAPVQVAPPPVVSTPAPVAPTSVPTVAPPPTPAGFRTHGPWVVGALYTVVPSGPLLLIAEPDAVEGEEKQWYAITRGLYVGVTLSNSLAVNAVSGVSRSGMKGHATQALAAAAFNEMLAYNMVAVLHQLALIDSVTYFSFPIA
ncbi:hypothetical protein B0H13DRAFT_2345390 [Mycena leptocephala]|nr:hypothetical protein B0H13DRAFT_2345390 [Mycena leptocephala]